VAEILGLTVSHFPYLRFKYWAMPSVMRGLVGGPWADKPQGDISKWPEAMRKEWGDDLGETAGTQAQARQVEQFHKIGAALDEFKPDVWVVLYRGINEPKAEKRPNLWVFLQDELEMQFFNLRGQRSNYHEEDPDRVVNLKVHTEAGQHLVKHLQSAGFDPWVGPGQPAENFLSGMTHLDWDKLTFSTPVIPIGIDPFGFDRQRTQVGLGPWDKNGPPPLTPAEAFQLGREMAKAFRASPWRVALIASTNWSNAQNTLADAGRVHPAIEADQKRFEQWRNNEFDKWGENWTFDEMEENAQWECLISIVLAGAMTEIGANVKHADLQTTYVLNSDWVTTIFEPK